MNAIYLSYFFLAVMLSGAINASASNGPPRFRQSAVDKILARRKSASLSGRFSIVSDNTLINMDLSRWAEIVASKIEASTGLDLSTGIDRKFRILVRSSGTNVTPAVDFSSGIIDGKLIFTMNIDGYDSVSISRCRLIFCRMALANWIAERKTDVSAREISAFFNKHEPLQWFSTGLWLDVEDSAHGRIHDSAMAKWESGRVPTVASFLKHYARGKNTLKGDVAWAFFSWLKTLDRKGAVFDRMLDRVASGREITSEWLAEIAGKRSTDDLEMDWDSFFLQSRRMVVTPGNPSLGAIRQLEGELLLYRGNSGIPLDCEINEKDGFGALIEKKNAPWLNEFARSKKMSLRLVAAGRGEDFREVAESYCRFLDKLKKGEDNSKLKSMLQKANRKLGKMRGRLLDKKPARLESQGEGAEKK